MSQSYQENLEGAIHLRPAPGKRHENICTRLHREIIAGLDGHSDAKLLAPRTQLQISPDTALCPDLALVNTADGKLFLAIEVINRDDHRTDTVIKKEIYEKMRVPRLWIVDPRYDNVEIYQSIEFGLQLKSILGGNEILSDSLIPQLRITVADLFAAS